MASSDRDVLSSDVVPKNYDISLKNLELGGNFSYDGTVKIDIKVNKSTKTIVLNAHQLQFKSAKVNAPGGTELSTTKFSHDASAQRVSLAFDSEISSVADAVLEIDFTGTMNTDMAGFYRSKYKPAVTPAPSVPKVGEHHYMFSTQFESSDARRAIPCFDEPNLKATFDFEIEIPEDQTALSNMPEKSTREGAKGRKIVSFERTPVMSTYLLAWSFGDFEYVEDFTRRKYNGKQLPVRVYTTRGLKEHGRWGLEHAHQVVDFFSDIFQIEYPLPKVDLLAVHEFAIGAMENWGLITYRTTAILFDEKSSDTRYKNRVAYVVAHELAHQWFGNLVTMDWWSELWLNEGFATWVGWHAIDHIHPDWEVWSQFVTEGFQTSLDLDSLRGSHPIEVPVKNALEVDQIFDAISYLKGSSAIRMLSSYLGVETFLQGVADYLKAHAYGNATTNDLWAALSKASGKDVTTFMDPWIRKIGYPLLTIAEEPGQITVRQSRFLSTGDVQPSEDDVLWWVPLGLKTGPSAATALAGALTTKEDTLRDIDDSFYKLNADMTGFYRTNYPPARLTALGAARDKLSVQDRIGLVGDAAALAIAGDGTSAGLMALCEEFRDETNYLVWAQVLTCLAKVRSIFASNAGVSAALKAFVLKLTRPAVEKIGWEASPDESLLTGQLRSLLLSSAGGAGDQGIIAEAKRRFDAYVAPDKTPINPNLRLTVFRLNVENGGTEAYEAVKRDYLSTTSVDGKELCLTAMGRVQTPELAKDFLDFQFGEHVAIQDAHTGSKMLALNPKTRYALWEWFQANWVRVRGKLSGNTVVLDRYVKMSLSDFADKGVGMEIEKFFEGKDTRGFDRGLVQVSDTVKRNATYKERDERLLAEWLEAKGYA